MLENREDEILIQEIKHTKKLPLRLGDLFTIPFFILFFALLLFILLNFVDTNKNLYYVFFFPMSIILMFFFTVGRIMLRLQKVKTINYFLTNQRIFFIDAKLGNILKSFDLAEYEFEYFEKADSSGYITINKKPKTISEYDIWEFNQVRGVALFENSSIMYNIDNVYKVYQLIKEQALKK